MFFLLFGKISDQTLNVIFYNVILRFHMRVHSEILLFFLEIFLQHVRTSHADVYCLRFGIVAVFQNLRLLGLVVYSYYLGFGYLLRVLRRSGFL